MITDKVITMDYGSGGIKTSQLIEEIFVPAFRNEELSALGDGALLPAMNKMAFSTDSFVIDPIEFPGGNIGHLCVCGTANDVAMCGAKPKFMSVGMILEEGFPIDTLKRIVDSIRETAAKEGIKVVTGDTKVVEHGKADGIYINTSGIGEIECSDLSADRIQKGDKIIVSGTVGDHGTAIMLARNDLGIFSELKSDCMPLYTLASTAWNTGGIRVIRDATRGGIATTLNEFTEGRDFGMVLEQSAVPVREEVKSACAMLGLDPLYCANEGKMLCIASAERAEDIVKALRNVPGGENAAIIGTVTDEHPGKVVLVNNLGAGRILTKLTGAQLPRIC